MDTTKGRGELAQLTPLFEARLQYQSEMEVVVSAETQEGELVGSGDGTVTGALRSRASSLVDVCWQLCLCRMSRAGILPPPRQHLCTVHPAGVIETSDGAEVWFDARGYGLRGADQSQPHLWTLTMAVQFTTTNPRYQWLNSALGVAISEFDERAGCALWRAFVP